MYKLKIKILLYLLNNLNFILYFYLNLNKINNKYFKIFKNESLFLNESIKEDGKIKIKYNIKKTSESKTHKLGLNNLKEAKIYFITKKYMYSSIEKTPQDFTIAINQNADKNNIEISNYLYDVDDNISANYKLSSIFKKIDEFKPSHLLIYDDWLFKINYSNNNEFKKYIEGIDKKIKIIIIAGDKHYHKALDDIAVYRRFCHKIISLSSWSPILSCKNICYLPPLIDNEFISRNKVLDVSFSGSLQPERLEIINFAKHIANKHKLRFLFNIHSRDVKNMLNYESYAEILGKSIAIINISIKEIVDHEQNKNEKYANLLTSRTFEAINCETLIIQYINRNDDTLILNQFFTLNEDYIQFSSKNELERIFIDIKNNPAIYIEMGKRAKIKYEKYKIQYLNHLLN
jgi:hypothetical protein